MSNISVGFSLSVNYLISVPPISQPNGILFISVYCLHEGERSEGGEGREGERGKGGGGEAKMVCFDFNSPSDISPCGGWSSEALEYFESLYSNKQLFALALSKDPTNTYFLFLLDTSSVPGSTLNLGKELISKGFAK